MLASQAENASRSIGIIARLQKSMCKAHMEKARNSESIIPSRHRRVERKWSRFSISPARLREKVVEKTKWMGFTRRLWTLTTSF